MRVFYRVGDGFMAEIFLDFDQVFVVLHELGGEPVAPAVGEIHIGTFQ